MHIDDLEKIVHVAHTQNIQQSANALNITPGALSKTLKKVENQLKNPLFDRVGRNIQLNAQGKKFVAYAINITHEFNQMCSEFTDNQVKYHLKLSGPTVLLNAGVKQLTPWLNKQNVELTLDSLYEGDAIKSVLNGQSHIAMITNAALDEVENSQLKKVPLGTAVSNVIASQHHEIFTAFPNGKVTMANLLNYVFVCPKTSPFCGIERGLGSDGWHDQQYPRKIRFRSNDIHSLLSIVNQSAAIAYVPDSVIDTDKVRVIDIIDESVHYQEKYLFVYRESFAEGWLNQLMAQIKAN